MFYMRSGLLTNKKWRRPAECAVVSSQLEIAGLGAGEPCWIRTSDLLIKSQLLYRLS
jgi:hypothetical protein